MMEYRGQVLLNKWLEGDISYHEELELFAIAERDEMIREALEGYIGQQHFQGPVVPDSVKVVLHPEVKQRQRTGIRAAILQFVAVMIVLVTAGAVYLSSLQFNGQEAVAPLAEIEIITPRSQPVVASATKGDKVEQENRTIATPVVNERSAISIELEEEVLIALAEQDIETSIETQELLPHQEEILAKEFTEAINTEESEAQSDFTMNDQSSVELRATSSESLDIGLESFDNDLDEKIRNNVVFVENAAGDEVITGYEIEILPGNVGTSGASEMTQASDLNNIDVQAKVNMADASASRSATRTNVINNNLVIKEYVIQKRDLTHPPIQDFNSLVREKYKRRAKPVDGFYSYRRFLKAATNCLVEGRSDHEHLEEGIIKFRVFDDGQIEFLEFFGTQAGDCVQDISASVVQGPKWEIKDFYESLDIEVPFKTLYPYLF